MLIRRVSTYVGFTPNGGSIKPVHVANGVQRCIFGGFNTAMQIKRLIEIKSTLSFSKKSTFPTVYSERAVKQLTEISRLLDEGYRACYILVSLNPSVKEITINSEIEDYYKEFMKCIEKGMTYCAFSIRLHEQTPELYAKIKITI